MPFAVVRSAALAVAATACAPRPPDVPSEVANGPAAPLASRYATGQSWCFLAITPDWSFFGVVSDATHIVRFDPPDAVQWRVDCYHESGGVCVSGHLGDTLTPAPGMRWLATSQFGFLSPAVLADQKIHFVHETNEHRLDHFDGMTAPGEPIQYFVDSEGRVVGTHSRAEPSPPYLLLALEAEAPVGRKEACPFDPPRCAMAAARYSSQRLEGSVVDAPRLAGED